jgi:GxxExxY protein
MFNELKKQGLFVEKQKNILVYYDGEALGDYYADLIVSEKVIIELKACESNTRRA